jgi:hypothetical protein
MVETGMSRNHISHAWTKYRELIQNINSKVTSEPPKVLIDAIKQLEAQSKYPSILRVSKLSRMSYSNKTLQEQTSRAQANYENKLIPRIENLATDMPPAHEWSNKYFANQLGLSVHDLTCSEKMRRVIQKLKTHHEDEILANLIGVIGSKQVSEPLNYSELSAKIGIPYHKLKDNKRFRKIIQSAQNKSERYYYSKLIQNERCKDHLEYYNSYAKKLVVNLGLMDHDYSEIVTARCSICNKHYHIDVSNAPLQRDFAPVISAL